MRVNRLAVCALFLLSLVVAPAWAQDERELFRNLKSQSGAITLRDGLATLTVGPNFSYLSPADAEIFLTKIWRNPPGVGERKVLLMGLAAFWKVIAVGGVAAVAAIGSFVKRLTRRDTPPLG
jgi:hypothetical protein